VTVARAIDAPDTKLLVHALALSTAVENKIGRFVDGIGSAIKAKALAAIGDSQQPASKDRFAAGRTWVMFSSHRRSRPAHSPPLTFEGAVCAVGLVERIELGHILI
jgi:hypothetical protein